MSNEQHCNVKTNKEREMVISLADKLKSIAHPARLCIVKTLFYRGKCNVSFFSSCMPISQSNLSQHLTKLRDLGIVMATRSGQEIYYSLADNDIKKVVNVLFAKEEI